MRTARFLCGWLLAICWLPATLHCTLERAGVFSTVADVCCESDSSDKSVGAEDPVEHCVKDVCANVEASLVKHSPGALYAPSPDLLICLYRISAPAPVRDNVPDRRPADDAAQLLPNTWQFTARAALSPRAPSLS